jgi:SAM-dependent methyltransferase
MSVFGLYSRYYDLLYKDKDYQAEAGHIHKLIQKYGPDTKTVIDMGCGTGRHDFLLAEYGYNVTGIDMSKEMLDAARSRLLQSKNRQLRFFEGDIRDIRLNEKFDAAISLFHVVSYQITNKDIEAAFATARAHLKSCGIFIFDCWYGPAVLTDRPAVRIKRLEDDSVSITRIAEPVIHPNENRVDVNYHVLIIDKTTKMAEELKETHKMRYLFKPEIDFFLKKTGLDILESAEWLSGRDLGFETWGVCFVARG